MSASTSMNIVMSDRDKAAAIQEVVVTERKREGSAPMRRVRVKLAPKRDALVDLGKQTEAPARELVRDSTPEPASFSAALRSSVV